MPFYFDCIEEIPMINWNGHIGNATPLVAASCYKASGTADNGGEMM